MGALSFPIFFIPVIFVLQPLQLELLNLTWWRTMNRWRILGVDPTQIFWNISYYHAKTIECSATKFDTMTYQGQTMNMHTPASAPFGVLRERSPTVQKFSHEQYLCSKHRPSFTIFVYLIDNNFVSLPFLSNRKGARGLCLGYDICWGPF